MKRISRIIACAFAAAVCVTCATAFVACSDGGETEDTGKYTNVAYAENPTKYEYLDITLPEEGEGPYPLVIFIHGGNWIGLSRSYGVFDPMFDQLLADGYAVAYVDYTLSTYGANGLSSGFPQMIYDLKAAIRFLRVNAEAYSIDPDNMVLLGESAGAHLAMLCEATDGNSDYEDLTMGNAATSSSVSGVITVCCPTLYTLDDDATQACLQSILGFSNDGETVYTQEQLERVSPYYQVTDKMCPVFMAHGLADITIPYEHTVQLAEKLTELIGEDNVTTWYPEDATHVDTAVFNSGEFLSKVESFLVKVHK